MSTDRKEMLKELIRQLHAGTPPQVVKERFKQALEGAGAVEIAKIEEELIREGMSRVEVQRLCDVHLAVFREQLERQKVEAAPTGPIRILTEEHRVLLEILERLSAASSKVLQAEDVGSVEEEISEVKRIAEELLDAENHYLREENVLFPVLEKHGISEPPAMMWMEHNKLRDVKKRFHSLVESFETLSFEEFKRQLNEVVGSLSDVLSSHIFRENNILFQAAEKVVTKQEWENVKKEFDEVGYCSFTPRELIAPPEGGTLERSAPEAGAVPEGVLQFETGALSKNEIEGILDTLPVDITFVGEDNSVRFFSKAEKRVFVRTKAVLGRKVQQCHPQKSVHVVNRIVESFRAGKKNVAEFWIPVKDRLINIRYFAVRDKDGRYLGTLEVTQDITDIKKIEGERRLLDWKD